MEQQKCVSAAGKGQPQAAVLPAEPDLRSVETVFRNWSTRSRQADTLRRKICSTLPFEACLCGQLSVASEKLQGDFVFLEIGGNPAAGQYGYFRLSSLCASQWPIGSRCDHS